MSRGASVMHHLCIGGACREDVGRMQVYSAGHCGGCGRCGGGCRGVMMRRVGGFWRGVGLGSGDGMGCFGAGGYLYTTWWAEGGFEGLWGIGGCGWEGEVYNKVWCGEGWGYGMLTGGVWDVILEGARGEGWGSCVGGCGEDGLGNLEKCFGVMRRVNWRKSGIC